MHPLLQPREAFRFARSLPLLPTLHDAIEQIELATRTIEKREPATTSESASATSSCTSTQDSNTCAKPTDSSATLPIVLGAVIPIVCALAVCFYLHRRHVKKQRLEDAQDPHKSLDFGLGSSSSPASKKSRPRKAVPEMVVTGSNNSMRRARGMSLDIDVGSPYILPAGLQSSGNTIHSMSRSMKDQNDPYRPITLIKSDDSSSPYPRTKGDNSSSFTTSSVGTDSTNAHLVKNAQNMSHSFPARGDSKSAHGTPSIMSGNSSIRHPPPSYGSPRMGSQSPPMMHGSSFDKESQPFLRDQSPAPERSPRPTVPNVGLIDTPTSPPASSLGSRMLPPTNAHIKGMPSPPSSRTPSVQPPKSSHVNSIDSEVLNEFRDLNLAAVIETSEPSRPAAPPAGPAQISSPNTVTTDNLGYDPERLSMRPLPPDDPHEDPETRANRIRSFYKEYFDDRRPDQVGKPQPKQGAYYEDYGQEFLNEAAMYDPATGQFVMPSKAPFAQPVTRRAMTPPSRAPPKFKGSGSKHTSSGSSGGSSGPGRAHFSAGSGNVHPSRDRAATNVSARKSLPPPMPLSTLPTPHMLRDDSALFLANDFAPPPSFRDRAAGSRPASPLGEKRPYSPTVRAHTPLATSFDDLAAMPSPHALRNSGTFTALDFAPPPRIRDSDNGSDSGSIRSARSGISPMHNNAIRSGAYRVSRIPKELAGTRDDLAAALKPSWEQRG